MRTFFRGPDEECPNHTWNLPGDSKPNAQNRKKEGNEDCCLCSMVYLMKAVKTAHMISLVPCLALSPSKSMSSRSRTRFMATS